MTDGDVEAGGLVSSVNDTFLREEEDGRSEVSVVDRERGGCLDWNVGNGRGN